MSGSETTNLNLNSTKDGARPSHEAVQSHTGDATDAAKDSQERLDRVADESAQRATNRIHADEQKNPEDTIFSNI